MGWMAVGESVSTGTLWDTRRPPRGNFSLTKYGVSTWWTTYFPITRGTEMESTNENLKDMESSASGDSDKGSCTETPRIGATGWDPVGQGAGETSLIGGGGRPSPNNRENQRRYRKEVRKASKRPGGPSVAPLTNYLGRLGYTGLYLGTLKLGWDPWWLLPESVYNPRGKPWISCLLLTSPT